MGTVYIVYQELKMKEFSTRGNTIFFRPQKKNANIPHIIFVTPLSKKLGIKHFY
jgi:hypothetical protein